MENELLSMGLSAIVGGLITGLGSFFAMKTQLAVMKNDITHIYHELERLR